MIKKYLFKKNIIKFDSVKIIKATKFLKNTLS